MSFLFLSHAGEDKKQRIRPLVEAFVTEGETVWIDRPGKDGLGFDQTYIEKNNIDYLQSGRSWSTSIQTALRESGAVIGCLSRSLLQNKTVLKDELTFADTSQKLVTCIVDDLSFAELRFLGNGLLDLSNHQSPRIDCRIVQEALKARRDGQFSIDVLPKTTRDEWEKVRGLISSANRVRREPRPLSSADVAAAAALLMRIPVGPILHVAHIPIRIIQAFGQKLASAQKVDAAFVQYDTLIRAAFPEGYTETQIILRKGEMPPFGTLSPDAYWTQAFAIAGLKARRTVAAFLAAPIGRWALESAGVGDVADRFLAQLQKPATFVK